MIYTLGHSRRSLEEFLGIMREYGIEVLVDIRRWPTSKLEHFKRERLEEALKGIGTSYVWLGHTLGGKLRPRKNSVNVCIKSPGFRAYCDRMLEPDFQEKACELVEMSKNKVVCIMCAEALPWKCHRWFLSDFLVFKGARVVHIIRLGVEREHKINKFARKTERGLIYDNC